MWNGDSGELIISVLKKAEGSFGSSWTLVLGRSIIITVRSLLQRQSRRCLLGSRLGRSRNLSPITLSCCHFPFLGIKRETIWQLYWVKFQQVYVIQQHADLHLCLKRTVHTKNENCAITNSPLCLYKPVWKYFEKSHSIFSYNES